MALDQYKLKLKRIKAGANESLPGYSLSYKAETPDHGRAGYDILSALAVNSDVIIELNTDLFENFSGKAQVCAAALESAIQARNLVYSRIEVRSERNVSYLGIPVESKKKNKKKALHIAAYVPNSIWKEETFHTVLPACGGSYYITDRPMEAGAIVNGIWNIPEEEKTSMFRMVVFNMAEFGQMGIATNSAGVDELRALLGIK